MPVIRTLWSRVYIAIATLSWGVLIAGFGFHAALSYILLIVAGESALTETLTTFAYYYVTTATTVGYGDLSPATDNGRLAALLLILPGSIALFTAVLGKAVADIGNFWRQRMNGMGNFSKRAGHTVIVGWQGARTRRLIAGLMADDMGGERPVLIAPALDENPYPECVDFVLSEGVSDFSAFSRAGAANATALIIRGDSDDDTMAGSLAARAAAPSVHLVAYFESDAHAALIRRQVPDIEAVSSMSADLLVRAARDPGASRLAELMFSGDTDDTAFSMPLPAAAGGAAYRQAAAALKDRHDVTVIGLRCNAEQKVDLNCSSDRMLKEGDTLFYIADSRLDGSLIDWASIHGKNLQETNQ